MPFDNTSTETTVDTPASLMLEAAIRLIEQPKHWCQGMPEVFRDDDVAYCAWGATRQACAWNAGRPASDGEWAANNGEWTDRFFQAVYALNAVARRHSYRDISYLNDNARTTHAMMLEVMREAVEYARGMS